MLLIEAVTAYTAALAMMETETDYATAHALVLLKKRLQPHAEFFAERELELAREYGAAGPDGKLAADELGRFPFRDEEAGREYQRRKLELGSVELQEAWEKLRAPRPERIRPAVLEALSPFITFGEEESREAT